MLDDNVSQTKKLISLMTAHIGKANAIKVNDIVREIHADDDSLTQSPARKVIRDAIISLRLPIASCSKGYFMAANDEEAYDYIQNLNDRSRGIKQRIQAFKKAARRRGLI